jgi:cytochrome P450
MNKCPFNLKEINSSFDAADAYAEARAHHGPVFEAGDLGEYVAVIGYDEVRKAASDDAGLCSAQGATIPALGVNRALPTESDDPEHREYRRLLQPEFQPGRVKQWSGRIAEIADEAIDEFIETGKGDLREVAERIPAVLIAEILGAPGRSSDMVRLTDELNSAAAGATAEAGNVRLRFSAFIEDLVSAAEADPDYPGTLGFIVRAELGGKKLTHQEALSLVTTLVIAGQETTVNGIASLLWLVGTHPEVKRRLLEDHSLIPQTIKEALRLESPVAMMGRTATRPMEVGGVTVAPGTKVGLFFGAANLDATQFDNPNVFDIDRNGQPHLSFGHGIHRCLGEHLARLEMCVALERVLDRIPDYEVDGEVTVGTNFPMNRGLLALPVKFAPRSKLGTGGAAPTGLKQQEAPDDHG